MVKQESQRRIGLLCGFTAYILWGLLPLYWPLLQPAGAFEILAHRIVWSCAATVAVLWLFRRRDRILAILRQPKRLGLIVAASVAITVNWGVYIWAVNNGHVVETSLGYFINPLVTVACGVLVLRERLRPAQWTAVAVGGAAVLVLTTGTERFPWIALVLAGSFAAYGYLKKNIALGGLESLAAETVLQVLPALGFLMWLEVQGQSTFASHGWGHAALLVGAGVVTVVPMVAFGSSTIRVPMSTLGLMQYLSPICQFLIGVSYFKESMPPERWAAFSLVWLALVILSGDALWARRRGRLPQSGVVAENREQPEGTKTQL